MPAETTEVTPGPKRKISGPPTWLIVLLIAALGFTYFAKYGNQGSGTFELPFGESSIAKLEGTFMHSFSGGEDLGGGAVQSPQTWKYTFTDDNTFVTFLEDVQQFSGTWTQNGNTIAVTVPAIDGQTQAYTWIGELDVNATTITVGDIVWEKIP